MQNPVKITMYLNEGDQWQELPLYLEILRYLREQKIAGATVLHAIAGYTLEGGIETTSLIDVDGKLPIVIESIDAADTIDRILPTLKKMAGKRLITREAIQVWE